MLYRMTNKAFIAKPVNAPVQAAAANASPNAPPTEGIVSAEINGITIAITQPIK